MRSEDFTLKPQEAARLEDVDALVEQGVNRTTAEALVKRLDLILNQQFYAMLEASSQDHTTEAAKQFIMASVVAYIHDWAAERILLASIAGTVSLEALKREA